MSRHILPLRDYDDASVCGWDPPLSTYYALLWENGDGGEEPTTWLGFLPCEFPTVDDLASALKPYGTLPAELVARLEADKRKEGEWMTDDPPGPVRNPYHPAHTELPDGSRLVSDGSDSGGIWCFDD
jgi:hypothetical protein